MKKFWKALGIAALAAAIPVRFKRDEATGKKKFQSLLISVDVGPNEEGEGTSVGINIGEGVLTNAVSGLVNSKKEMVHFADDDPEAAVVHGEIIDFAQAAAEQAQAAADEAQDAAEAAQDAADEAQAIADELQEAAEAAQEAAADAEEATEEDFDPEL